MRFTYEQLMNNFNKNVSFLSRHYPKLLEMLNVPKGSIRVNLDPEGRLDAFVGSVMVYGGDAYKKSLEQVQRFRQLPIRLYPNLRIEKCISDEIIASRHCKRLQEIIGLNIICPQYPKDDYMPFLLVVGLGFGLHIKMLLETYKVQNLMIVDIPLFAHLSLYTVDWQELLHTYSASDKSLTLFIDDSFLKPEMIDVKVQEIVSTITVTGPMVVYWGYYFEHLRYNPPILLNEWLSKSGTVSDFFKGFLDDELWSLEWTLEKIEKKIPLYYGGYKVPKGSVAFVLGAGPSLDNAIEKIIQYKDRAIIFSCGSTITALEKVGLVPDFHVEIERTKYTYDILTEVDRRFLKQTRLIANNPLWTQCFNLFEKGYMFLKLNDTGASIFRDMAIPIIQSTGPTVTAGGVALAAELGFDEIYLFGVDLGSRDPKKHHSSRTNYFKEDSLLSKSPPEFPIEYPANFGGVAYTNMWFASTARAIEKIIRVYKPKVFNASDGIMIEGATPLKIDYFDLSDKVRINKHFLMNTIDKNFKIDYTDKLIPSTILSNLYNEFDILIEHCKSLATDDFSSIDRVATTFMRLNALLRGYSDMLFALLYHNTYLWTTAALGYAIELNENDRQIFMKEFWKIYIEFLQDAKKAIESIQKKFTKNPKVQMR